MNPKLEQPRQWRRQCWRHAALLPAAFLLGGAAEAHDALDPAGVQAARISHLWWLFFWVCAAVYVLTMAFLAIPVFRRRRMRDAEGSDDPITSPDATDRPGERRRTVVVTGAVGLTVVVLFVLMISEFVTGARIHSLASKDPNPLIVKVVGHQWWWEVVYPDPVPANQASTANEIHIPVGRPVKFELSSTDVIHSFWVPNLHGKKDLVPGHATSTWLQADRPGVYDGQCAEFCGQQHAHMRIRVVAESEVEFEQWLQRQRQSAAEPGNDWQKRGQQVFLSSSCILCHTIQGTRANARMGPDLTHIGGRQTLAAGTIPNTPGHLAGWIIDPHKIKPGVRMPQNALSPQDLRALLEYLESLK